MTEVERVRAAYARRQAGGRYDARRPDVVDRRALRDRVWGRKLLARQRSLGTVLEVGCGTGEPLRWALDTGAAAAIGVDAIDDRLATARATQPRVVVILADGRRLPVPDGSVDTVLASTLFSSVLSDDVARDIASEMLRVLGPGGIVLWFDFHRDNPFNTDVRPVPQKAIRELFPNCAIELESVVLAPPIAARLLRWPRVAALLEMVPLLRTHLAGSITPR